MRAKKIDSNQNEIVKALRKIIGKDNVELDHDDILVGFRGKTYWYEIKSPDAISKKTGKVLESEITPSEKKRRDTFTGHYRIVWTLEQILKDIGVVRK